LNGKFSPEKALPPLWGKADVRQGGSAVAVIIMWDVRDDQDCPTMGNEGDLDLRNYPRIPNDPAAYNGPC
jgi:hypothetical protein